ncbi:MAG: sensor histidine kinase [Candidatus Gallimonas sp.]
MIEGLRRKFVLAAMCSVFIVLAAIIGIINATGYANVVRNADKVVSLLRDGNGEFGGKEPSSGEEETHMRPYSPETPYETRFFTVVVNAEGAVESVNLSKIAAIGAEDASEYAMRLYRKGSEKGFYGSYRYGTTPADDGGTMYIFVDCTRELSSFRSFLWISIVVGLGGLLCVFALVQFLSGRVMKPVAESYAKQKRFITDASHEIKTPLTIIGADADVLEMQSGENEWTTAIKEQVKRLTALTEKLVFLARMDEENFALNAIDFALSDAVEETVKPYEAVALSRGLQLRCSIEKNLTCCGNEGMIRQAIGLLMDNAMKYADDGGRVSVELRAVGNRNRLTVGNTASGVRDGDLGVLFERFYRSDRSRNSETGGSGIGLSVVKAVATAHRGKVGAYGKDGFVFFTVTL